jgi:hypothetical protein
VTITNAQFRIDYPEFTDPVKYPDSAINYYLTLAYQMLNANRWMSQLDLGAELFVAHNVAIEARALIEANNGGIPGTTTGPIASKSVDKVSVSFDVGSGIELEAGHWNLTIYGTRFIKLARMKGAGPLQIGIGVAPPGNGPAWPGPWTPPSITGFGS